MSKLLTYWFFGCFLIGTGVALHRNHCPNDPVAPTAEILMSVAAWPAGIFAVLFLNDKTPRCER